MLCDTIMPLSACVPAFMPLCSLYGTNAPRLSYPEIYLGRRADMTLEELAFYMGSGAQPMQDKTSGKSIRVTAARLVCAVCNGLPEEPLLQHKPWDGSWGLQIQVSHACQRDKCVNPRHLFWCKAAVNLSQNKDNSFERELQRLDIDKFYELGNFQTKWQADMQAAHVVGS